MKSVQKTISIIIATFNAGSTLEQAIKSVLTQPIACELLIIDGGSTDNTLAIINKYKEGIHYWHSSPDRGIYDALNKGIDQATGEWIYFLGADDSLMPDVLSTIYPQLSVPSVVVYGDVLFDIGHKMTSLFGPRIYLQNTVHHQSAFYHHSLFVNFRYNLTFKTIADYELNLFVYIKQLPTKYIPITVALCRSGGASADWRRTLSETNAIRSVYMDTKFKRHIFNMLLTVYYHWKQVHRSVTGRNV